MRGICIISLFLIATAAVSQVQLPALVSDNAVLQRNTEINLFGYAAPGEKVTMLFDGKTASAITNQDGRWTITLSPQKTGGPHDITFKGSNEVTIHNILFGDVWLCSG